LKNSNNLIIDYHPTQPKLIKIYPFSLINYQIKQENDGEKEHKYDRRDLNPEIEDS